MTGTSIKKKLFDNKLNTKATKKTLAMTTLAGLLAACNSDNDVVELVVAPVVSTTLSGAVVKGPLSGAIVFADADGDGIQGPDEISVTTASDGSYTVSSSNSTSSIIAMTTEDTIDTSSGEKLSGITLKAPAGSTVITPATTILEAQPDIEPAQLAIALGIPTVAADGSAIDLLTFNPYAADADPAAALASEKAAQQVMVTIKAVSAAAEGAGMSVENAFEQAMASVAEVVSVAAEKIDVTSTASIAAAEATMATNKVDFADTETMAAVTTAVKAKVTAAAVADDTIVINETAFATTLTSAAAAVANVVAAIDAITDTDLTSSASMGTFATLTDVVSEIKSAAEAEVIAPGSGAELVTFTDAAAVATAVTAAVEVVEAYVETTAVVDPVVDGSGASGGGGGGAPVVVVSAEAAAAAAEAAAAASAAVAEAEAALVEAAADLAAGSWTVNSVTGATWDGASAAAQSLDGTFVGGVYAVSTDVQVEADDFTAAFDEAAVSLTDGVIGYLSIPNLTPPTLGSGVDQEVTITIEESGTSGKLVIGFNVDWTLSGGSYTLSSDDTALNIVYTERDNSSTTVDIANPTVNLLTVANDGLYGGATSLNIDALQLITKLNATNIYVFDNLEARFATAGTTLDVTVDTTNIGLYMGTEQMNSITSTIDII